MNSRKEKQDKSIVVRSEFHYGQTRMIVRVDGEREYDTTKLSKRTARRLLAVLESIPTGCRQVELDSDFSPIVYLHWKAARIDAGMYPAAHPREVLDAEYDSYRNACDTAEQSAFIARLVAAGTAVSDLTPEERDEAQRLGFKFPVFTPLCDWKPVAMSWKVL